MIKDVMDDVRDSMEKSIESLTKDLGSIRTGRASTSLVDKLRVIYYDTPTPLIQLALISVPEPQLILFCHLTGQPADDLVAPVLDVVVYYSCSHTSDSSSRSVRMARK